MSSKNAADPKPADAPTENVKTIVSLAIFLHLFCVFVVLSSNFAPSSLQQRLVDLMSPYTTTLHLDPNYVPFHLTSAQGEYRFYQWLVEAPDGQQFRFPDSQWKGGFSRQRLEMLGRVPAAYSRFESNEVPAEAARGLARFVANRRGASDSPGTNPENGANQNGANQNGANQNSADLENGAAESDAFGRYAVRCVQYLGDDDPQTADPDNSDNVDVVYEADVWLNADGEWSVLRRSPLAEVAPPVARSIPSNRANP